MPKKILKLLSQFILVLLIFAVIGASVLYLYLAPQLPSIEGLSDVRLQVPLRIYSSDGSLMGEFGEKRRTPKTLEEIPLLMRQAFLAAEDDRFFKHPGVDYQGIARAALHLIMTGERGQGGSTITMQLARNFYLSREKTYVRKLSEILLALKIERELSKQKILELYLNKIYLGNRAYGVAAAARAYYGRELEQLDLAQIAMIAGLPKAPSRYNPIVDPERAISRREYVLTRMLELGYISTELYDQAHVAPVTAERHSAQIQLEAPYVNEMVRIEIVSQFGDEAYSRGLKVYTTIQDKLQNAASSSLQQGLIDYDQRHGYRGAVRNVNLDDYLMATDDLIADQEQVDVARVLENDSEHGRFKPALVLKLQETGAAEDLDFVPHALVALSDGTEIRLDLGAVSWARPFISLNRQGDEPKQLSEVLKAGDVIRVLQNDDGKWMLGQAPEVQGALVSLTPNDGAITALAGGFNYMKSNFNRAVQARRQAGSGFKPIIYSAALSRDHTPASIINDAPVVFEDAALEGAWRPENYSGKFYGPTRLREALVKSRNLVSIRLLNAIGVNRAVRFARRFGFDSEALPHDLSLALGSCEVSPLEMARAFAVFANGGYLTQPYFITRIEDADGRILFEADPSVACVACVLAKRRQPALKPSAPDDDEPLVAANEEVIGQPLAAGGTVAEAPKVETAGEDDEETLVRLPKQADQTLEPRLAYIMHSMLQDVVLRGTGRRAMQLNRRDLAGKTGTTNDQRDAWFNGYHPDLVAVTWVGYDHLKPLGNSETGSRAALPLWIEFMREALAGKPEKQLPRPEGLATVKINADTGEAATDTDSNTVFELFRAENAPVPGKTVSNPVPDRGGDSQPIPEQLF